MTPAKFRARNDTPNTIAFYIVNGPDGGNPAVPVWTMAAGETSAFEEGRKPGNYEFLASASAGGVGISVSKTLTIAAGSTNTIRVFENSSGLNLALE